MSVETIEDAPPMPAVSDVFAGADADAPYGRFGNGKPRKSPPKGVPSPNKTRAQKPSKGQTDYRPGIRSFGQIGAFITSFFAPLDAVAIADHTEKIAEAAQITAQQEARFAAVLDKVLAVGPYSVMLTAALPLFVQVLHNHDMVPASVAENLGGRSKQSIIDELESSYAVHTD